MENLKNRYDEVIEVVGEVSVKDRLFYSDEFEEFAIAWLAEYENEVMGITYGELDECYELVRKAIIEVETGFIEDEQQVETGWEVLDVITKKTNRMMGNYDEDFTDGISEGLAFLETQISYDYLPFTNEIVVTNEGEEVLRHNAKDYVYLLDYDELSKIHNPLKSEFELKEKEKQTIIMEFTEVPKMSKWVAIPLTTENVVSFFSELKKIFRIMTEKDILKRTLIFLMKKVKLKNI